MSLRGPSGGGADLTAAKAVVVYNSGTGKYAARPSTAVSVEWVGPADPAVAANIADGVSIAQNNDTWVNTA
jgi:hypothetical protein